jgi:hypothetical protein
MRVSSIYSATFVAAIKEFDEVKTLDKLKDASRAACSSYEKFVKELNDKLKDADLEASLRAHKEKVAS